MSFNSIGYSALKPEQSNAITALQRNIGYCDGTHLGNLNVGLLLTLMHMQLKIRMIIYLYKFNVNI